jgi:Asp-tRNA(Asn)/Glu-tRNA(Gln) amidotransferase C subunit
MAEKTGLSRKVFLSIAEASGLDIKDPHMKELYSYLQQILPGLRSIEKLDLTGVEPLMPSLPAKEESR